MSAPSTPSPTCNGSSPHNESNVDRALFDIGIVAHTARLADAHTLADITQASFLGIDDGKLGCDANHRRTWKQLAHSTTAWSVVLEDDALPVDNFLAQLAQVLHAAPVPIVSLYLGTSRPPQWQQWIRKTTVNATARDACFILAPRLFHAVGVAIATPLVPKMLAHYKAHPLLPIDEAISHWANATNQRIAYTWPSLVDHRDGPTVAIHRDHAARVAPRKAWRTGCRQRWNCSTV